ncbi:hypothetical protein BDY19DRAFT_256851 [Irpex rosettiformis]|uniref:Uncharacterized protein n=1 Tax=Irpex rosettiformis TaxID=378272 RepID=A0ACB8UGP9_9APHY|nr:hypothetical protein BDY19DRAFT_256851 [Irpex rosettiformis]
MRNPFLIARTVFFCILVYLNVLAIGFAAWNVSAMKSAKMPVLGAPIFVIFNACALFFFQLLAIAELASPCARTAQIGFECGWTAVMSILQLAATIDITLNGPPTYCYQTASGRLWALCSSSNVLVAIAWASSSILLLYFLTIFITSASHYSSYRGVWWTTVYNMPWFEKGVVHPPRITFPEPSIPKPLPPESPYENPCFGAYHETAPLSPPTVPWLKSYHSELESNNTRTSSAKSDDSLRPMWARNAKNRRGVDPPFSPVPNTAQRISNAFKSHWSSSTGAGPAPPPPPPKMEMPTPQKIRGSFVDCHRTSYGHFPTDVQDVDLPIARTHMREWVRAERAVLAH